MGWKHRLLGLFILLMLAISGRFSANAQDQEAAQGSSPPDPRVEVVRTYLSLTPSQTERLTALLRTREETLAPLLRALAAQSAELSRLLQAPSPDPVAVGSVVIALRGTRAQIENVQDTFRNGFLALLTEAQKRRLAGLEQFVENQQAAPAFLSLGLLDVDLSPEPRRTIRKALGLDLP
ncbi:MAG: periplasmic heavy metal sensor [Blastocatellia bacterium]|nr:periplasmic heavy metal sensor [Blastocatellia bacterium]MCS7157952.1 periplasmic heavy metal sensor [Blastocatellia bacterium]MCX7752459.1 periplasmic heavy metal sensor [Blastocatellia bacterium]MDW8167426.1 periplasmic heavy metal sensor [Acidobacteriota bacterium]MDW8257396.1 periplasmic heavy metal sensor [Acidobacteriota bacterium]